MDIIKGRTQEEGTQNIDIFHADTGRRNTEKFGIIRKYCNTDRRNTETQI
jgi:hypothetical protein